MRRAVMLGGLAALGGAAALLLWPSSSPSSNPSLDAPSRSGQPGQILPAFTSSRGDTAASQAASIEHTGALAGKTSLPDGEYACYGSGMQVLAGLGFKVNGSDYTDLEGMERGTIAVRGDQVVFTGGHLDGQVGRAFDGKSFRIAKMAGCEKW